VSWKCLGSGTLNPKKNPKSQTNRIEREKILKICLLLWLKQTKVAPVSYGPYQFHGMVNLQVNPVQ
jgi:hypothetical protein